MNKKRHRSTLSSLRYDRGPGANRAALPRVLVPFRPLAALAYCPYATPWGFFRRPPACAGLGSQPVDSARRSSPFRGMPGIVWSRGLWVTATRSLVEAVSGCPQALGHAIRRIGIGFVAGSIGAGAGLENRRCAYNLGRLYSANGLGFFRCHRFGPSRWRHVISVAATTLFRTSPERTQAGA